MDENPDQVTAWKDVDARDPGSDHPAGDVRLPKRTASARVAILAGSLGALSVAAMDLVPTTPFTSWSA